MKVRLLLFVLLLVCFGAAQSLQAQSVPASPVSQTTATGAPASMDNQGIRNYLLGPGDTLDVRVFGQPDFNTEVDVDSQGNIVLPFVEKPIPAQCRTDRDVAKDITAAYSKYLKNPQVSVRTIGRNSRPPATIQGAVAVPQRVQMQRSIRLNELLAIAGGVTERANGTIQVLHTEPVMCPGPDNPVEADEPKVVVEGVQIPTFKVYNIADLLAGKAESNPVIRPGDVVRALEAEPVYITGSVMSPQGVYLRPEMTITRALAMVGGIKKNAKQEDIRIYRQKPGERQAKVIHVNLAAIKKQKTQDVFLEPYDIIEVGDTSALAPSRLPETLLGSLTGALNSTVGSLPLRVIY